MVEPQGKVHFRSTVHNTSISSNPPSHSSHRKSQSIYERQSPEIYNSDIVAGNGTFGVVYQSTIPETGERIAIKKVLQDSRYKNRELEIMKELSHPNIVALRHSFFTPGSKPNELFLNLVMEYIPDTLHKVIRNYYKSSQPIPLILIKIYSYQLIRSLFYLHLQGICHRDIKPQNLLLDPHSHRLALCDFGSAKRLVRGEPNIAYISSRYYRAPELCLGATEYSTSIDLWSAGCVIAEMFTGQPFFPGESANEQIVEIFKTLGTPTRDVLAEMNKQFSGRLPDIRATGIGRTAKGKINAEGIAFLERLLVLSPLRRTSAAQALQLPFFDEIKSPGCRLPNGAPLPELFNWTEVERKQN